MNIIDGFHNSNGVWCTDTEGIATDYYKNLFTTSNNLNMDGVLASVEKVVTDDMARNLVCTYIEDEIRVALFKMHPSKSSGSDGMSSFFFQKFQHIVGYDVTAVVLSILHLGMYLHKINFTHFVLITKKNNP